MGDLQHASHLHLFSAMLFCNWTSTVFICTNNIRKVLGGWVSVCCYYSLYVATLPVACFHLISCNHVEPLPLNDNVATYPETDVFELIHCVSQVQQQSHKSNMHKSTVNFQGLGYKFNSVLSLVLPLSEVPPLCPPPREAQNRCCLLL